MLTLSDIKAGKAKFTMSNNKGDYYTYKVNKAKNGSLWFVSILTGADNDSSFTYLGIITKDNNFKLTQNSKFTENCVSYKVFKWLVSIVQGIKQLPIGYDVVHAGCCLKCGRTLTTPSSIESGYGRKV